MDPLDPTEQTIRGLPGGLLAERFRLSHLVRDELLVEPPLLLDLPLIDMWFKLQNVRAMVDCVRDDGE